MYNHLKKISRMKKTTRTLVIVSVAMEGSCSAAALWCMVETMAGLGRHRQGAGQVVVRHSLSGLSSLRFTEKVGSWHAHKQHCPPSQCHFASKLIKGGQVQHRMGQKGSELLCQPRAWKEREGEKRNTFSHDSQEWPGLIWL